MRNGNTAKVLFGSLIVISLLACGLAAPGDPQPQVNQIEPQPPVDDISTGSGCNNPYFPAVQNASWSYKSAGSSVGEYTYTEVVSEMRADGFTVTSDHVEGFSRLLEWSCTQQGLVSGTFDGGTAAGVSAQQFQMDLTTTSIEGITLPNKINPGDQWTQTIKTEGKGEIGGGEVLSSGTTVFTMNALGEESVTVPAGTFTAMKVQTDIILDVLLTFQGSTTPYPSAFSQMLYWVPGVGLVKRESTQETGGSTYTEIVELQSYSIP